MTVTIGCYHAHHSNIDIIQQALAPYDVELLHFVDPGLDRRKTDPLFSLEKSRHKIKETLDWVAASRVDAILVTCTFFTAYMPEELDYGIPVIKIDDPLFDSICESERPPLLVFTNPATVQGTLDRLIRHAMRRGKQLDLQSHTLENTFDLLMQGKKAAYAALVAEGLSRLTEEQSDREVWAAQLSMVQAAEEAERANEVRVGNPLKALVEHLAERLQLSVREV